MGALCTLVAKAFLVFSFITLFDAFLDHSKQEEKTQIELIDLGTSEAYNLKDNSIDIKLFSYPALPASIGYFRVFKDFGCALARKEFCLNDGLYEEIELKNCTAA